MLYLLQEKQQLGSYTTVLYCKFGYLCGDSVPTERDHEGVFADGVHRERIAKCCATGWADPDDLDLQQLKQTNFYSTVREEVGQGEVAELLPNWRSCKRSVYVAQHISEKGMLTQEKINWEPYLSLACN